MKTIEEYFIEVEEFHNKLKSRSTETIHTDSYKQTVRELYADWQQVKISLKPFLSDNIITDIDEQVTSLLAESRKSRSKVKTSVNYLKHIENIYVKYIYPEISYRQIEAGFVNGLVSEIEKINSDKYHDYLEEAIQCVQAGAYRGAVVLAWQAGMYGLYRKLESQEDEIHVAYQKKFKKRLEVDINNFWDFQKISDRNILILAESVGIIDKSLKDMLQREKDIRNKAAHPGIYDVGPNGTKALLETIIQLLVKLDL